MTQYERNTTVSEESRPTVDGAASSVSSSRTIETRPSGGETARRVAIFLFGIIQVLIGLRILLLLIDAREANDLVSWILNASQLFVVPFIGMLGRDELVSSGSVLDLAAVLAFIGWTALELVVLWGVNVFRREPA